MIVDIENANVGHWDYKSPVNLWSFPWPEVRARSRVVITDARARESVSPKVTPRSRVAITDVITNPRVFREGVDVGKFYELRKGNG